MLFRSTIVPTEASPVRPLPSTVSILPDIAFNDAQSLMNGYVAFYQDARPTMTFEIVGNRHADAMAAVLTLDIGYLVRVIEADNNINTTAHVQQVSHRISAGRTHQARFGVEQISGIGSPFIVGTSTINGTDVVWF